MPEPAARRRKTVALVLSGIFPGLGQLYTRQPFKGAVFVALGLVLSWLTGRAVPTGPAGARSPGHRAARAAGRAARRVVVVRHRCVARRRPLSRGPDGDASSPRSRRWR